MATYRRRSPPSRARKFGPKPTESALSKAENKKFAPKSPPWQFVMVVVPFEGLRYLRDDGKKYWASISRSLVEFENGDLEFGTPDVRGYRVFPSFGDIPRLPLHAAFFLQKNGDRQNPLPGWKSPRFSAAQTTAGEWRAAHILNLNKETT